MILHLIASASMITMFSFTAALAMLAVVAQDMVQE